MPKQAYRNIKYWVTIQNKQEIMYDTLLLPITFTYRCRFLCVLNWTFIKHWHVKIKEPSFCWLVFFLNVWSTCCSLKTWRKCQSKNKKWHQIYSQTWITKPQPRVLHMRGTHRASVSDHVLSANQTTVPLQRPLPSRQGVAAKSRFCCRRGTQKRGAASGWRP